MKVLSIVGARPQFVKLAPLSKEISSKFNEVIVHTGQHFDEEMSQFFFNDLGIPQPKYNLEISGGHHGEQTGRMLKAIEEVLYLEKPDLVIVFGDTNSTLAGALAATKIKLRILHIEAGLRSFNKFMPEETNRIVTDHVSDYLFAPTLTAMKNLRREGLKDKAIFTGDIMVDSLEMAINVADSNKILESLDLSLNDYYLCTLHRPYNVDDEKIIIRILKGLGKLSKTVIFPIHPRTKTIIKNNNVRLSSNIKVINPVGYIDFCILQANSLKIITDSGGIQKEAYLLKKPCITLRSETEWVETIKSGWNLLLNPKEVLDISVLIENFQPKKKYCQIFGQNVAKRMFNEIVRIFS
ncbi:MAG: UDP-N-acetylglucosamine 2-epimerase (non-hydrolyzing) [Candidatus Lokiarchaeota archaeon]|nr:UDP-N-acetylglucosamine 2-epimerase (non-hydrolyzing) [Candidatus Lokiarchaeota archaeon]